MAKDSIARALASGAGAAASGAQASANRANFAAKSNSLRALSTRLMRPPVVSSYGNSIVAVVYSADVLRWSIYEGGLQYGSNFGVAGDTTTQMLARVGAVTGDGALMLEGANDARTLATARLHYDNFDAIISNLLSRGITPAMVAASPYYQQETFSAGYLIAEQLLCLKYGIDYYDPWADFIDETNGRWRDAAFTADLNGTAMSVSAVSSGKIVPGMVLTNANIPAGSYVVSGPSAGGTGSYTISSPATTATGVSVVANAATDHIHPLLPVQGAVTTKLAALIRGDATSPKFTPRASIVDASNCSIIGGNQLFTSFGTSNGQPAPAGWTVTGGTPFTGLQTTAPDGHRGNFYRMTANGAGGTPGVQRTISSSLFQVGDQIAISFYGRYTYAPNGTLTASVSGGASQQLAVLSGRDFGWQRYTCYVTITSLTNLVLSFGLLNSASGAAFEFGEIDVINITKTISR